MRRTLLWLRVPAAVAFGILILAAGGVLVVLDRGLAGFGMSLPEAYRILRAQQRDAAAMRNAEGPIRTPHGIAERGFVRIGGIEQWVTIRGDDERNPAILILHGGPGDAYSQLAYFLRDWERALTIVQWDQRGAGRTYERYGNATPDVTLDRLIEDGAEVAQYARRRLHQPKIILIGHSWGSALGIYLIKRHSELFSAFVGTGQIVRTADLEQRYYAYALARVSADYHEAAIAELRRLGPPPYGTIGADGIVRKWLNRYLADADKRYLLMSVGVALRNAAYTLADFRALQAGHLAFSLPTLNRTYDAIDLDSLGDDVPVPYFIIDGRSDRLTPPDLAIRYFERVRAPHKAFFLIDGGHFAFMSNSDEFLRILLDCVVPIGAQDGATPACRRGQKLASPKVPM